MSCSSLDAIFSCQVKKKVILSLSNQTPQRKCYRAYNALPSFVKYFRRYVEISYLVPQFLEVFSCKYPFVQQSADNGLRGAASKYDTRFSLPLDTRQLKGLTPAQYLQRYCIVSSTWMAFYKSVFKSYDKMHKK